MERDVLLAYVAGFFDGEGCVTTGGGSRFRVTISSTNYEILEFIKSNMGGCINDQHVPVNPKWRTAWKWIITRKKDLYDFLVQIEPYLIIKKSQANAVIDYYNSIGFSRTTAKTFDREKYESIKKEIKRLKTS